MVTVLLMLEIYHQEELKTDPGGIQDVIIFGHIAGDQEQEVEPIYGTIIQRLMNGYWFMVLLQLIRFLFMEQ